MTGIKLRIRKHNIWELLRCIHAEMHYEAKVYRFEYTFVMPVSDTTTSQSCE